MFLFFRWLSPCWRLLSGPPPLPSPRPKWAMHPLLEATPLVPPFPLPLPPFHPLDPLGLLPTVPLTVPPLWSHLDLPFPSTFPSLKENVTMETMRTKTTANMEPGEKTRTKEAIIAKKILRTKTRSKDPMEVNMEAGKIVKRQIQKYCYGKCISFNLFCRWK